MGHLAESALGSSVRSKVDTIRIAIPKRRNGVTPSASSRALLAERPKIAN